MLRHRICPCFVTDLFKSDKAIYTCCQMVSMGPVCSICIKYGGNFVYPLLLHGDSIILFQSWGPFE